MFLTVSKQQLGSLKEHSVVGKNHCQRQPVVPKGMNNEVRLHVNIQDSAPLQWLHPNVKHLEQGPVIEQAHKEFRASR